MSGENKFFRFIWRFNALALAAAALAAVLATVGVLVAVLWNSAHVEQNLHFAAVVKQADSIDTYQLSDYVTRLPSAGEEIFALQRVTGWDGRSKARRAFDVSSYDWVAYDHVNLLVVRRDGSSQWLFRGYGRAILSEETVCASPAEAAVCPNPIAVAIRTSGIKKDEHGAYKLAGEEALYLYRVGGTEAVRIMSAEAILDSHEVGADRYVVVFENGSGRFAASYSMPDFKLVSLRPLPNVPK